MTIPKEVRSRWYFVIVMPINPDGSGPADLEYGTTLTWEVWDQELTTHGSFSYLPDAIQECERLNGEYYSTHKSNFTEEEGEAYTS